MPLLGIRRAMGFCAEWDDLGGCPHVAFLEYNVVTAPEIDMRVDSPPAFDPDSPCDHTKSRLPTCLVPRGPIFWTWQCTTWRA